MTDTERLDWIGLHDIELHRDPSNKKWGILIYDMNNGDLRIIDSKYENPRDAIDAAMKAEESK